MRHAGVLFLVLPVSAPVVNANPSLLPVTHHIPLDEFIRAQYLAGAKAGVSPEFRNLIDTGKDAACNALAFGITRAKQQDTAGWFHVLYQSLHPLQRVARDESLLGEDIFQLLVVLGGKLVIVSFFDDHAALLGFAHAAAAGAIHTVEQLCLRPGEIGAVGSVELEAEPEFLAFRLGEIRV